MTAISLDAMDLAALLCSRVCHDVISPVGAIVNGLEVLDEEKDAETRNFAMELVKKSAVMASAKLQFCRLAFGAAGSAGASIDTGDAESVTRGLFSDEKVKLDWQLPRTLMPKNKVKLILNLCLIAASFVPRGGTISVSASGEGEAETLRFDVKGPYARVSHGLADMLAGRPESGVVDAHAIQPFFTGLMARTVGMAVDIAAAADGAVITARPETIDATAGSADDALSAPAAAG